MIRKLLIAVFPIAILVFLTSGKMSDNGKAGRTGSPGESNCTSGCHSTYSLNSGSGSVTIQSPGTSGFVYTPGQTYNMSVTVSQSGIGLFGVGIEALTAAGDNAGTLNITDPASTTIKTSTVGAYTRRNIVQTLNGGQGSDSKVFNFSWTAPAAGTGDVTFYYAGMAANGNGGKSGDWVYTGSQVFTDVACQPPVSAISVSGDTLYATPGATYEWYLDGNFITGAVNSYYVPVQNGTYIVIVYDSLGCFGTSSPYIFSTVGINTVNNDNQITVFHNTSSNTLSIQASDAFNNSQLMIFDISGRTIRQTVLRSGENTVDMNGLAEGVYTILSANGTNKFSKRILISR